jgi:hypothetical protein
VPSTSARASSTSARGPSTSARVPATPVAPLSPLVPPSRQPPRRVVEETVTPRVMLEVCMFIFNLLYGLH